MKKITASLLAILALIWGFPLSSHASIFTTDPNLPPVDGEYVSADDIVFSDPNFHVALSELTFGNFTGISRIDVGPDEIQSFLMALSAKGQIGLDQIGLDTVDSILLSGPVQTLAEGKVGSTTGSYNTEIISMNLSGEVSLTGGITLQILLRESPTLLSMGLTGITDLGSGRFQIDSFFDIFTEISFDGGQAWTPANGPSRFTLQPSPSPIPVPAAVWLFGSALVGLVGLSRRKKSA